MGGNIFLTGFMGSGKSTVGERLAKKSRRIFIDADREIEKAAGMSVSDMFALFGEEYFRGREEETIASACKSEGAVVATGGGAVKRFGNIKNMRENGTVYWLRWNPEEIHEHIKNDRSRPLLNVPDPMAAIRGLMAERENLYNRAAHYIIHCGGKSADEITNEVLQIENRSDKRSEP